MKGYLLDTSVLSLLAPGRSDADERFFAWVRQRDRSLFISSVTILEIQQGIDKLGRSGIARRADALSKWRDLIIDTFGTNALALDVDLALVAGRLSDEATPIGRHPGIADVIIAATALHHDLLLLTRNVRRFSPLGVAVLDPLDRLPD